MPNFKFDVDADGIALVTWDMPDRSMNVIDMDVIAELAAHRREGRRPTPPSRARSSPRARTPSAAAPISPCWSAWARSMPTWCEARARRPPRNYVFDESRKLSQLYRRIETCGKPWVCALNGTAMGGGFELALACHHRIAADNPKTRLGLPEIKIGLFPGAGGTQRIARMLPPADALQYPAQGRPAQDSTAPRR